MYDDDMFYTGSQESEYRKYELDQGAFFKLCLNADTCAFAAALGNIEIKAWLKKQ